MGGVVSSLASQVLVGLVLACQQLVGFRHLSTSSGAGESSRQCGRANGELAIGKGDESAATLAAWCGGGGCCCCCSCSTAASLRSSSGRTAHAADSHEARSRECERRRAAKNNGVQCARCLRGDGDGGGHCHPHRRRCRLPCCCGNFCADPLAAAAGARSCFCCSASSSSSDRKQATRVGEGDRKSAAAAVDVAASEHENHDRDNAVAPRQKERNQLAWPSAMISDHNNNNSYCTCCNLNHHKQQQQQQSHLSDCTLSINNNNYRNNLAPRKGNKSVLQHQARVSCTTKVTTSGNRTRFCQNEFYPNRQSSSEKSAADSVSASDEGEVEDADAESTISSISIRKRPNPITHQARAPKYNNVKQQQQLNQRQVALLVADYNQFHQNDDSPARPILQDKTTTINATKCCSNNRNRRILLDSNLLEVETTKTITKTTTTTTTKLKFSKRDTEGYDQDEMAVLMSSQVLPAAAAASVSRGPQLPRQVAPVSNRQLKRQSNLRPDKSAVGEPQAEILTNDNINLKRQVQKQKQQLQASQQRSTNTSSGTQITSRTFYNQSSSDSGSSSGGGSKPIVAKNRNLVKLAKQQRKPAASGAPTGISHPPPLVNLSNRQTTSINKQASGGGGQQQASKHNHNLANNIANQNNKRHQQQQQNKSHQYYQPQQTNKFTFDRNQICNREHRSLSTCSSITTESNESGSGVAPPSSSTSGASGCNYSPASSGYSSPCSGGSTVTVSHQHLLSDKQFKKFKPQPIEIRTTNRYHQVDGSLAQVSTPNSTASSLDSGTGGSLVDLVGVGPKQQPLHPTVSALLLSTANLSLSKQKIAMTPPPPPPVKKSKKMHQAQQQLQQRVYKNHLHLNRSQSSSASSSPVALVSPAADRKPTQYTQDATYLARSYEELAPPPVIPATVAPPRPWLKPEEQLNYLSKGRLRQLKRSLDHSDQRNPQRHHLVRCYSALNDDQVASKRRAISGDHQPATSGDFTVLSYNVLSDRMVNTERFPSSPETALNWLYRRELILRQLLDYNADVIALQELEWEQYETYFKPKLELADGEDGEQASGYCSVFEPKSRARTMDWQMRKRVDGCAIFYKRQKFKLVARHLLEFNQIAMANARGSEAMLNRVMTKDNIGLAAVLELRDDGAADCRHLSSDDHQSEESHSNQHKPASPPTPQARQRLIVCNTHIHWDPDCCDVKLVQTIMLMNELKHIARHYSDDLNNNDNSYSPPASIDNHQDQLLLPLILLGDFNSLPKSGVLEFLLQANIDSSHKDFKDIKYTQCSNALALRDCALKPNRSNSGSPDPSAPLLAPGSLLRRASQQPTSGAVAANGGQANPLLPERTLVAAQELLSRRLSSPVTNSTAAQSPANNEKQDSQAREDELLLRYEHPFRLASAYERGVMPFTNYTTSFKATIDYIFFDQQQVELTGLLGPLDKQWLKANRIQGFPQMQFPSDHLPLLARFRLLRCDNSTVSSPATATANSSTSSSVLLKDCHGGATGREYSSTLQMIRREM